MSSPSGLVTVGETMVLLHRDSGEPLEPGLGFVLGFGGAESNVAIGIQRLGGRAEWVSALGMDDFGLLIEAGIASEGVKVSARAVPDRPTGLMVKTLTPSAERKVQYYRSSSAASTLGAQDVPIKQISGSQMVHITGITAALSSSCRDLIEGVLDAAGNYGVPVSFDINYRSALWSQNDAVSVLLPIAQKSTIVSGNEEEFEMLAGAGGSPLDVMRRLEDQGIGHLVMKRGAKGADSLVAGKHFHVDALEVSVVDTVGAGDAFVAGYLFALLENKDLSTAIELGAVCGAFACTHPGDWEGLPRASEVKRFRRAKL